MELLNLDVDRIIIHQVFRRDNEGQIVPPDQSHEFINFDQSAKNTFISRITDALGSSSKAVAMEIVDESPNSLPVLVNQLIDQDDETFAVSSYDVATKLAQVQTTRNILGGIVIVFTGTYSSTLKPYIGIIKAEVHSGYQKAKNANQEITLKFVEELLLTPGTRLYKTAGFFKKSSQSGNSNNLNEVWSVMVSDYQISHTEGKAAAKYFYVDFLGCGYPQTSARTTMNFYNSTKTFIADLEVSAEKKIDLFNALNTYLKVDTSQTISGTEFGEKYLEGSETKDKYAKHLANTDIPSISFTKDNEYINGNLKTRKLKFRKNIRIVAPADVLEEYVSIETIEPEDGDESTGKWTKVLIKDTIVDQE